MLHKLVNPKTSHTVYPTYTEMFTWCPVKTWHHRIAPCAFSLIKLSFVVSHDIDEDQISFCELLMEKSRQVQRVRKPFTFNCLEMNMLFFIHNVKVKLWIHLPIILVWQTACFGHLNCWRKKRKNTVQCYSKPFLNTIPIILNGFVDLMAMADYYV